MDTKDHENIQHYSCLSHVWAWSFACTIDRGCLFRGSSLRIRTGYERSRLWYLRRSVVRDGRNLLRYGKRAPRWCQRIWVDPQACASFVTSHGRSFTGQVLGGDWDRSRFPLTEHHKIGACFAHWNDGIPWEATGIFDWFADRLAGGASFDGCRTMEDVKLRYERLDIIFDQIKRDRRLRPIGEVEYDGFREHGGVYIHVGHDNAPVFGNGGCHRLAMSVVLQLSAIPAQLGIVHEHSLPVWKQRFMRQT